MKRSLWIPGTPRAKQRPRVGRGRAYTPRTTKSYEEAIAWAWITRYPAQLALACPVWVSIIAVGGGADCDNIAKLCLDALNGVAFQDDALVKRLSVRRLEAVVGAPVGTYIEVRPLTGAWRAPLARRLTRLIESAASRAFATSPAPR